MKTKIHFINKLLQVGKFWAYFPNFTLITHTLLVDQDTIYKLLDPVAVQGTYETCHGHQPVQAAHLGGSEVVLVQGALLHTERRSHGGWNT